MSDNESQPSNRGSTPSSCTSATSATSATEFLNSERISTVSPRPSLQSAYSPRAGGRAPSGSGDSSTQSVYLRAEGRRESDAKCQLRPVAATVSTRIQIPRQDCHGGRRWSTLRTQGEPNPTSSHVRSFEKVRRSHGRGGPAKRRCTEDRFYDERRAKYITRKREWCHNKPRIRQSAAQRRRFERIQLEHFRKAVQLREPQPSWAGGRSQSCRDQHSGHSASSASTGRWRGRGRRGRLQQL